MLAPMTEAKRAEAWLKKRFRDHADTESAVWQKAYMKSALEFHGVSSEIVRTAARDFLGEHPKLDHDALVSVVDGLFASRFFDVRSAGVVMLERKVKLLDAEDLPWLVDLVHRGACWAHVDSLATNVIGAVVKREPKTLRLLPAWAKDDDFWVRRTALLAQERQLARGEGDFALFARIAAPMLPEREFFIRKAIGWVLRSTSKKRPELVHAFLLANKETVSGLTMREGSKYLPAAMRTPLVSATPTATRRAPKQLGRA